MEFEAALGLSGSNAQVGAGSEEIWRDTPTPRIATDAIERGEVRNPREECGGARCESHATPLSGGGRAGGTEVQRDGDGWEGPLGGTPSNTARGRRTAGSV